MKAFRKNASGQFIVQLPCDDRCGHLFASVAGIHCFRNNFFVDAIFTATSAVCVTGLIVVDTGSYFTLFGQHIILALIQLGGLGVMTISVTIFLMIGKQVSFKQRMAMQDLFAHTPREDINQLVKSILWPGKRIEEAIITLPDHSQIKCSLIVRSLLQNTDPVIIDGKRYFYHCGAQFMGIPSIARDNIIKYVLEKERGELKRLSREYE